MLVVGLARTGIAASLFAAGYGAAVTATDEKSESELHEAAAKLRAAEVKLELGGHANATFLEQDLIVLSPGVPVNLAPVALARSRGIPVWSEIELAWRFLRGRLVAITGSNGKTTTTSLAAHILQTAAIPALVGGNIGVPLLSVVESSTDASVTVAEISSFQLEAIEAFRPEIGVLLNLTPDHLDRHASFEEYAAAKMRMFENQLDRDCAVLNADDPEVTKRMPAHQQVFWFSRQKRVAAGAFLRDEQIIFRHEGLEVELARRDQIALRGEHNVENVLAACAAAYLAGATPAAIAGGVRTFRAVEHRLELAGEIGGVKYYNDSKATNVDAALKAIEAFSEPLRERARLAITIGAAAEKIAADLGDAVETVHAGTLDRAVQIARERARAGDVVLLAPACSSFDQFDDYEDRGRTFKELVARLEKQANAPGPERSDADERTGNATHSAA